MSSNWYARNFGPVSNVVSDVRHVVLGGWFGRNFEPHPTRAPLAEREAPDPGDRDIHGNERGIDR